MPREKVEQAVTEVFASERERIASEIIGRYVLTNAQTTLFKSRSRVRTIDQTIPDYEFWDKLRRGKAKGYTLGGLFAQRIEQIFGSWVMGRGVEITLEESGDPDNEGDPRNYTDNTIAKFLGDNQALLMDAYKDALGLGDQYIIVNADGTLSVPSPDTVTVERNDEDYREVEAVEIKTRMEKATVIDRYEPERRTITIRRPQETGDIREETQTFINMLGRIPIVHIAHGMTANETNGHPIHEELRPLYDQYDDTIYKQLDGAKLLGNPIPTFKGLENVTDAIGDNDPAQYDTYTDKDGATATRTQVNLDQNSMVLLSADGDFAFVGPTVGFTEDTQQALKTLFLLLLDHTGIPEFVWGNEMSSARASAEVQMTQFVRDIEGRQKGNEEWLLDLVQIWLETEAIVDRRLVLDELSVEWPPLIEEDEELQLKRIDFAKSRNLLTDKTALELLHLVDDPQKEAEEAQAEAEERMEAMFPEGDTAGFQNRLNQESGGGQGE